MMGFLEMLREGEAGELTEEQERFLAIVYRSSERLQRLVGDLLFVGRLDATGLELDLKPVGIHDVAREALESHAALARSRGLELVDRARRRCRRSAATAERLQQLVGNLVSNALKFTPAGGVVTTRTFVEGATAVIEVEDTGIGIPAPELPQVFERFFRSSTATEQAIPGTGLGLVISKAIAEAHGGVDLGALGGGPRARASASSCRWLGAAARCLTRIVALDVGSSSVRAVAFDERGEAEPGDAHLAYDSPSTPTSSSTAAARCSRRSATATSSPSRASGTRWCALDDHDRPLTPVLTWRDRCGAPPDARSGRVPPRAPGCFLHPSFWPAKIRRLRRGPARRRGIVSFGDYLLLKLAGELAHERLDGERHRPLRPESRSRGTTRRSPRSASTRRSCRRSPTNRLRACCRRSATAPARTSARAASNEAAQP